MTSNARGNISENARGGIRLALLCFIGAGGIAPSGWAEASAAAVQSNWPASVVRAKGFGRPPAHLSGARARLMARRAAEVTAVRNLAAKLRLPPGSYVRGFRYLPPIYRPDGWVEVVVEYRPK